MAVGAHAGDTGCAISEHSGGPGAGWGGWARGEGDADFLALTAKESIFQKLSENYFHTGILYSNY